MKKETRANPRKSRTNPAPAPPSIDVGGHVVRRTVTARGGAAVVTTRPRTVLPDPYPPYPDDRPLIAELLDPTLTRAEVDAHLATPTRSPSQERRPHRLDPGHAVPPCLRRHQVRQVRAGRHRPG